MQIMKKLTKSLLTIIKKKIDSLNRKLSIIPVLLLIISLSAQAQKWELAKNEDGIKVYTRKVEGRSVKSYKAKAVINAPINKVYFIYTDLKSYQRVMQDQSEIELLEKNNNRYILYSKMDMPWPADDRDMVSETEIEKKDNGQIIIRSKCLKNRLAPKKDYVRIKDCWEIVTLTPVGNDKVEIQIEGLFDVGGSLPGWIVNMFLVDGPFDTIGNIKKIVE